MNLCGAGCCRDVAIYFVDTFVRDSMTVGVRLAVCRFPLLRASTFKRPQPTPPLHLPIPRSHLCPIDPLQIGTGPTVSAIIEEIGRRTVDGKLKVSKPTPECNSLLVSPAGRSSGQPFPPRTSRLWRGGRCLPRSAPSRASRPRTSWIAQQWMLRWKKPRRWGEP